MIPSGRPRNSIPSWCDLAPEYIPLEPLLYQGCLRLDAVRAARRTRLAELEERFVDALATRLLTLPGRMATGSEASAGQEEQNVSFDREQGVALIVAGSKDPAAESSERTLLLTINNEEIALGEELETLATDIFSELGYLPAQYVSSAAGRAGRGYAPFRGDGGRRRTGTDCAGHL